MQSPDGLWLVKFPYALEESGLGFLAKQWLGFLHWDKWFMWAASQVSLLVKDAIWKAA